MLPEILQLGPFLVEPNGRLAFREKGTEARFTFIWRKRRFSAVLGDGVVALTASLGHVPSTATGAALREGALAALRMLPACLPAGWQLRLTREHRVEICADQTMDWPANASALMQPLVAFLLTLAPFMDIMEEAGF